MTNTPDLAPQPLDLAIIGMGCLFPKAENLGAYWANIKHAVDGISDVPKTHWNPDDYFDADPKSPDMTYAKRGGFLSSIDFNPLEFGIAPRDIEATDTTQLLGLVAAKQALTDSGVNFTPGTPKSIDRSKVSVLLGVTGTLELVIPLGARLGHPKWKQAMLDAGVPADVAQDAVERISESYVPWQENSFPGLLGNVVAGRIANRLDLHGTNCVVDAACASSLSAIHLAAMELTTGKADVVVTGGTDTFNDIFMFMCFSKTPALSKTGNSRPFDANGDGTILGEGLGLVVLKRLKDAVAAGDRVYAVIKSIGTSSDGKGNAIYAPSAEGQKRCLQDAYHRAGVSPETIELVEAHGTGTKVGDSVEASALAEVYGGASTTKSRPWCAIGSVKSQVGHTKAAAGAAGLIKAVMALHFKVLPPTMKVTMPVEPLMRADTPFYVNTQMRPWLARAEHARRAGLSAFGFGGSNFHAVLEEFTPTKLTPDWDGQVEILMLSGTLSTIRKALDKLPDTTTWNTFARAAEASRSAFDVTAEARLILVAHRPTTDLANLLKTTKAKLALGEMKPWQTPEGAFFGAYAPTGKLGVLFPGQGSQAVGMLRELACVFPEMLETLATMDGHQSPRISDVIYPPTNFAEGAKAAQDVALRSTDVAQPAIGAVSLGAWRVLSERFGLTAEAFAGHSYGEVTALAASGRLNLPDFAFVSRQRGELMAAQKAKHGDAGAMLAVIAQLDKIQAVILTQKLNVTLANLNSPTQTVLSGSTTEIERASQAFQAAGLRSTKLPVAAAFHSPLVADAAGPFRESLDQVTWKPGTKPVYANSTATPYPADEVSTRELLGAQLAKPVRFVELVVEMQKSGVTTFLEVGPGSVLTRLAEATLADMNLAGQALPLDASGGKRAGLHDLALLLARLAALGYAWNTKAWEAESLCRPAPDTKPAHTVPLSGANVMQARPKRPAKPTYLQTTKTPRNSILNAGKNMTDHGPDSGLNPALQLTQATLAALQQLQEQTAKLHKQFLDNQSQAQQTLFQLVAQQNAMLFPTGATIAPMQMVMPPPVPVVVPPPPTVAYVPPPTVAPPPVVVPRVVAPVASRRGVADILLEVVAEKTGYPTNMLNLEMTLDSDLGVDSIKRVEILSALQEKLPNAPVVKPEHLGTLHTLQDIADFLDAGHSTIAVEPEQMLTINESALAAAMAVSHSNGATTKPAKDTANLQSPGFGLPIPPAADNSSIFLPATTSLDQVSKVLLDVVAEKTGYPANMLNLDMTLDSDLGVDSIKRVEILSALQEKLPYAPVVKPEHLGTLHTLKDISRFLAGSQDNSPHTAKMDVTAIRTPPKTDDAMRIVPDMDANLSELLAPKTEQVSAIRPRTSYDVPPLSARRGPVNPGVNSTVAEIVSTLEGTRAPIFTATIDNVDRSILQVVDIDLASGRPRLALAPKSEFWLIGQADDPFAAEVVSQLQGSQFAVKQFPWLDPEIVKPTGSPSALLLVAPVFMQGVPVNRLALRWLQAVGPKLRQIARQGATTLVAAVPRLDGEFGLGDLSTDTDPTSGGLAGIIKTARIEWSDLNYKVVDVNASYSVTSASNAAAALVDELMLAGPLEVGVAAKHRCTLEPARTIRRAIGGAPILGAKDVILVTGGARGVTAEVAVTMAEAFRSTMILTGRTPLPTGPEPEWIRNLTDEAEMKRAIAEQLGASASPKSVGEFFAKTLAQREVSRTITRIQAAGGKAFYFSVNVSNGRQLADMIHQVKMKQGPITAIVHGAGVLADKRIDDLTLENFDAVYSTKVDGLRNILDLLANQELKAILLFSSTTARFGRTGQLAYAAANEVLNKTAQIESRKRPNSRVVSINWGPWEGGMVSPSLRKVFESEGIGLIPMTEGAIFAVQELAAAGKAVEVIALGKPGRSPKSSGMTASGSGSASSMSMPQPANPSSVVVPPPLTGAPAPELTVVFERNVDIASHPILRSHVMEHRAVLPMALHLEWLAHAALHNNPGLVFHGFNDLRVTQGVYVEEGSITALKAYAGKAVKNGGLFQVAVELRGKRRDGRDAIHSRAEIVLASSLSKAPTVDAMPLVDPYPHAMEEIYRYFLFHGPELHAIEQIDGLTDLAFIGSAYSAPPPADWLTTPLRPAWVADPMVLDASFQMMILWSFAQHGAGSLPCFAGRYRQFRRAFPTAPVKVVIRVTRDNGSFARADIDYIDSEGILIAQLQDYECVIDRQLDQAFRKNSLPTKVR
jgi:acyl transferase domain-containing protein/NAD(P)-dependent dehydrogenase (short-subunit alcohol dehydrogenase family)/acyl carrier protein